MVEVNRKGHTQVRCQHRPDQAQTTVTHTTYLVFAVSRTIGHRSNVDLVHGAIGP